MDLKDYKSLLGDIRVRFPEDFKYLEEHPDTVQLWFDELFKYRRLDVCMDVLKDISKGTMPKWAAYQREQIGTMIFKEARQREWDERHRDTREENSRKHQLRKETAPLIYRDKKMRDCFEQVQRLKHAGVSRALQSKFIDDFFEGRPMDEYSAYLGD